MAIGSWMLLLMMMLMTTMMQSVCSHGCKYNFEFSTNVA